VIFVPKPLGLLTHHRREKIVTLPSGERVRVSVDDSGTVYQVEHNDTLDAIVRPKTTTIRVRRREQD
jgi:hypothetical protein